jgi:hypothetical protein
VSLPRWGRALLVVLILLWLVGGPVVRQGFGVKNKWLNAWYMYKGQGKDICWVQWSTGDGEPVDRLATLGHPPWNRAPKHVRNLKNRAEVYAEARRLCAALGPAADLRAQAKCGSYAGWVPVEDGSRDLCQAKRGKR